MTDTGQQPERVEVTQADRDCAAAIVRAYRGDGDRRWGRRIEEGACDDGEIVQRVTRHRLTALTEAGRAGVGDGWQVVPREPTDQMTFVGQALRYVSANSIGEIYRQMLAAAPTPPLPADVPAPDVERMREALRPFAELAINFVDDHAYDDDVYRPPLHEPDMHVSVGDLRRARAALSQEPRP